MNKSIFLLIILLFSFPLIIATSVEATTVELKAVKDTWLEGATIQGDNSFFIIGRQGREGSSIIFPKKRSLVEFNLESIPNNAIIKNAVLKLNHNYCHGSATGTGPAVDVYVHEVLKEWREYEATQYKRTSTEYWDVPYLNLGTDAKSSPEAVVNIGNTNGFKFFNLTSLVSDWVYGKPNNGILIWTPDEDIGLCDRRFDSREFSDLSRRPTLMVEYDTAPDIVCLSDLNCGESSFSNYYCQNGDLYQDFETYTCNFPSTVNSFCSVNQGLPVLRDDCTENEFCLDGFSSCQNNLTSLYMQITASKDVWLEDSSNTGGNSFVIIGRQLGFPKKRALISFDFSCIPENVIVQDATMRLNHNYCHGVANGTGPAVDVYVHEVLKEWKEYEATQYKRTSTEYWNASYLNFGIDAKPVMETAVNIGTTNGLKFFDLTVLASRWLNNKSDNNGVLIWTPDEDAGICDRRFDSRESSNFSRRPFLFVNLSYVNDSFANKFYYDLDNDGFGDSNNIIYTCAQSMTGLVANNFDCDDSSALINPDVDEICDGLDNDCNGLIDDGLTRTFYNGPNGTENVGICSSGLEVCEIGNWIITQQNVLPAAELCDGLDNDCNNILDDGFDVDSDGFAVCMGDCNDNNVSINPGMSEICDGLDNDCNAFIDDGTCFGMCVDFDNDKYGSNGDLSCVGIGVDCNDNDKQINPGEIELCNTPYDDDCNNVSNEGCDNDGDTYSPPLDCNDENININPGAIEICNSVDDDCDGNVDNVPGCIDSDGDLIVDSIDICPNDPSNICNENATQFYVTQGTLTTLSTQNGEVSLQINQNDIVTDTVITVDRNIGLEPNFALSTGAAAVKNIFSYTFSPEGTQFNGDLVIAIYWDDIDNDGFEDTTLQREDRIDIFWYNTVTSKWEAQNANCNLANNYCILITNHFSDYALAAFTDIDADGYSDDDCNDEDYSINPGAIEIPGNSIDENCNGGIICDSALDWRNHGEFISCVAKESNRLYENGDITNEIKNKIVSLAAMSDIGK